MVEREREWDFLETPWWMGRGDGGRLFLLGSDLTFQHFEKHPRGRMDGIEGDLVSISIGQ